MPRPRPTTLAAGIAGLLLLGACAAGEPDGADPAEPSGAGSASEPGQPAADVPAELESYYTQDLSWTECEGGLECAEVEVPMDYGDPDGDRVTLALMRQAAEGPDAQGSLLLNPGGPGGSGTQMVGYIDSMVSQDLADSYDLVGFDPRGVNRSDAVDCISDPELDEQRATDYDLETDTGLRAFTAAAEQLAADCAENTGELLAHVDTESAARDLDVLRHVLGEEQLDYLGYSYGTLLGAVYADLFPERVGRLVLDGGLDPALTTAELSMGQAVGFEQALRAYAEDCLATEACPLSGDVDAAVGQVQTLLEVAASTPLPTATERDLTAPLAFSGIILPLYDDALWPALSSALGQAMTQNDGSQLLLLADAGAERREDGSYATNAQEAFMAINCLDYPVQGDLADWKQEAAELEEAAPTFGPALAYGDVLCDAWPHEPAGQRGAVAATGAEPILVVGTTGDPATPYEWSVALADQLESGRLLTYEGQGHTAYGRSNACITEAVDAYLLEGTLPEEGLVC